MLNRSPKLMIQSQNSNLVKFPRSDELDHYQKINESGNHRNSCTHNSINDN